jgi:hypothetical protein
MGLASSITALSRTVSHDADHAVAITPRVPKYIALTDSRGGPGQARFAIGFADDHSMLAPSVSPRNRLRRASGFHSPRISRRHDRVRGVELAAHRVGAPRKT